MRASTQNEELGAKWDVLDIPDDLKEKAAEYREKLIEMAVEQVFYSRPLCLGCCCMSRTTASCVESRDAVVDKDAQRMTGMMIAFAVSLLPILRMSACPLDLILRRVADAAAAVVRSAGR